MSHARRACRRLGNATAAASVLVAAAVLAPAPARSTETVPVKPSSASAGAQSSTAATGAVGGVQSPVNEGETMNLKINASDTDAGLVSAHVSIGASSASVSLCPAPASAGGAPIHGCPESVSEVPLSVGVGGAGAHVLTVTVTDAAGHLSTLVEQTIEVLAPPKQEGNTLTIGISNGRVGPHGELLSEEPGQGVLSYKEESPPPVCPSPMLAMRLASRPLGRTHQHVPMLWWGRRYRFKGRLTCLDGRRRVSAPNGTTVRVLYERHICTRNHHRCVVRSRKLTITVRKGRLKVRLRMVFAGAMVFRYRPSHGESVQVRLQVAVRHMRHRGGCPGPRRRQVGSCPRRPGRSR
jgi:hypothetical protein